MGNELEHLVNFWKTSLAEHRLLMSPSAIYLVEQTIKHLEAPLAKQERVWRVEELEEY